MRTRKVGRTVRRGFGCFKAYKLVERHLGRLSLFHPKENSRHGYLQVMDTVLYASLMHLSLEAGCEALQGPSADTVLRRLEALDLEGTVEAFNRALGTIARGFRRRLRGVTAAIDPTRKPYYGKPCPGAVGCRVKGAGRAFTYATLQVVRPIQLPLAIRPVQKGDSRKAVVEDLLDEASKVARVRLLLMDGGFYDSGVIEELRRRGISFIIRARATGRSKGHAVEGEWRPYIVSGKAETYITKIRVGEKGKKKQKVYVANRPMNLETYRLRWGIETSYRVLHGLMGWTRSRSRTVRLILFALATLLSALKLLLDTTSPTLRVTPSLEVLTLHSLPTPTTARAPPP